jgi:hypothetical protein
LIRLHEVSADVLGPRRVVNLPGLSVTAQEMVDALRVSFGADCAQLVGWSFEQRIQNIVGTWPRSWDCTRAQTLGMIQDQNFGQVIAAYARHLSPPRIE